MTGYVSDLIKMDYDLSRWLKECLVRGMGVCIMMRDSTDKLTEKEIRYALESEIESGAYQLHQQIEFARDRVVLFSEREEKDWRLAYQEEKALATKRYLDRQREDSAQKAKLEKTLNQLHQWHAQVQPGQAVSKGTISFGIKQLAEVIEFDYGHTAYRELILDQNFEDFVRTKKASAIERLQDAHKRLKEHLERERDRLNGYLELVNFVNARATEEAL